MTPKSIYFVIEHIGSERRVIWKPWTKKKDAQEAALRIAGAGFKTFAEAKRKGWVDVVRYDVAKGTSNE